MTDADRDRIEQKRDRPLATPTDLSRKATVDIAAAMNLILALQVDALAEALALVTAAGLKGENLVEVMQSSMARSGVLDVKAPNLLKGEFKPSFPLRLMHKDLGLALDLGNQLGVALPATAAAREAYNYVKGAAKEDLDYSAVMRFWKR